jgi:hypothetical protein
MVLSVIRIQFLSLYGDRLSFGNPWTHHVLTFTCLTWNMTSQLLYLYLWRHVACNSLCVWFLVRSVRVDGRTHSSVLWCDGWMRWLTGWVSQIFISLWVCRLGVACYFIFNTSAFFSCEVKAWLQLDHVFVAVSLSFYACLRLYQLYGGKNAECTVLRASLNYSTSLPLNFWLTLVSNTLVIVPPMEKRFFPLSLYLLLLLLKTEGTHPVCLCAVFRVTLYF